MGRRGVACQNPPARERARILCRSRNARPSLPCQTSLGPARSASEGSNLTIFGCSRLPGIPGGSSIRAGRVPMRRNRDAPGEDPGMVAKVERTQQPLGPGTAGTPPWKAPPGHLSLLSIRPLIDPHPESRDRRWQPIDPATRLSSKKPEHQLGLRFLVTQVRDAVRYRTGPWCSRLPWQSLVYATGLEGSDLSMSLEGGLQTTWRKTPRRQRKAFRTFIQQLGCSAIQTWGNQQLGFQETFPCRSVEQNSIPVCFPNGRKFHSSWAVKAKVHSARTASPSEYSFCHLECIELQFIVVAQGLVHVISKGI